jgi:uncharacterized membrane protein YhiD involved in acid resistance
MADATTAGLTSPAGIGSSAAQGVSYGTGGAFSGDANSLYQQVTQSEWQNYMQNFVPIENQLIKFASDTTQPAQAMATAQTNMNAAEAQQPQIQQNRLDQYGIKLDQAGKQAAGMDQNLNAALGSVDAQNHAKDTTIQQQESILGAPMTGLT